MFSTTTATKQKANERDGAKEALRNFVSRSPNNHYTFDSERDAPQSEICRDDPNNHECITLQMNSRQMFAAMQSLGFYCSLPMDPGKTYMECKPLPK
ncbi:hypothetical protein EV361DRAFT_430065 [Lentinula raphanica]|nr:hypothetical protein C8R42DRAFT_654722 [Lentinula raphanica]KAJ3774808.1 hypothetical protein FB446DRAFT_453375 [Lentinula raphanica]KAJ3822873.1 hypothetical protein F5880DRAFT_614841 [Lentinula raphanica]KAJ3968268.1 hypothetical protein EV361DRAFT_430065 [Lentinula raphanica]